MMNFVVQNEEFCIKNEECCIKNDDFAADGGPLRFGDCFSGAGGLSLGLHAAGLEQKFAVENNVYSQRTFMLSHPPSVKLYREGLDTFLERIRAGADVSMMSTIF